MNCIIDGCPTQNTGNRGMCNAHYLRWYRHGDPLYQRQPKFTPCSVAGCADKTRRNGMCSRHSMKAYAHGDPEYIPQRMTLEERFWSHVDKTDTCWLWTGALTESGYGDFHTSDNRIHVVANRVVWEIAYGPIPAGLFVCHHCDVRCCVRPDHLFLGTAADNSRDMVEKRRNRRGESSPQAVLTDRLVRDLRLRRGRGETIRSIAREYGVSEYAVQAAATRKTWKHIE